MDWEMFTPWRALAGGALIGLAASLLLAANGRIAGISGVLRGALEPVRGDVAWRVAFLLGLVLGGLGVFAVDRSSFGPSPRGLALVAIAGALVGVGTLAANGCTSGHGVCGLSRLSRRSFVATLTFMGAGILTAGVARALGAGS